MEATETPAVITARAAVSEAAAKLDTIISGIKFAQANPAEVSNAERADLLLRAKVANRLVARLLRNYDRAVARSERSAR
jgi:hypothetical protein